MVRGSRWVDYNTHELLEMIGELEDERRWARLREGVLWALLIHIVLISALTWIPTYFFMCRRGRPFDAIKERKDLTYLDLPPDALRALSPGKRQAAQRKAADRQEDAGRDEARPTRPQRLLPGADARAAQAAGDAAYSAQSADSIAVEAPRPAAVPAKPNFALRSQNPAAARQMQKAMRGRGAAEGRKLRFRADCRCIPAPAPAACRYFLTPRAWTSAPGWRAGTTRRERTWDPLIPEEVNPPISKSGMVMIRFKVLPNGRLMDMQLEGRSGDTALDRAAWGASQAPAIRRFPGSSTGRTLNCAPTSSTTWSRSRLSSVRRSAELTCGIGAYSCRLGSLRRLPAGPCGLRL